MKNKTTTIVITICTLALLLSACTSGATTATSWGGATITDTAVYYADGGQLYALKVENGNTIWSYPEKASATRLFLAAPVVVGDQLLAADYGHMLTSLSIRDGKENWQFSDAKGKYIDSPLVVGETIIAPNTDNNLYALNLDGNLLWTYKGEHSFWAQPVSDGKTVFAPSMDHYLYAIDLVTGKQQWKVDLTASLVSRPILVDGILYLGNLDGNFFAVDSERGTIVWKKDVAGGVWGAPVFTEDKLFFGDQTGNINILNAADGSVVQLIETDSAMLGAGIAATDGIFFGNEKGDLVLIGYDGSKEWTRTVDTGSIYSNLSINDGTIIVVVTKGEKPLVAMDTNGNEIWYFTTKK